MKRDPLVPASLASVVAVPPLCRRADARRSPDVAGTERLLRHIAAGGIRNFMFGGNAQLFHITLRDYEALLEWLASLPDDWWLLPAAGPSFGRALDQAAALRRHRFPAVMILPGTDPRDPAGLETGLREIADAAETPLVLYLKEENGLGTPREAGLDALGRLVADGICVGIKYAVVRAQPEEDAYLAGLLRRVPRERVMSGLGERPAVVHLRDWSLPGFTTGSGCIAPESTRRLFEAATAGNWEEAERLRARFLPLEDCRDAWNPARVLHHAVELAGLARTGPLLPFLSPLDPLQLDRIREALAQLRAP